MQSTPNDRPHKSMEDSQRFVRMVAEHNGWSLNPDADFLNDLVEGLNTNYNRYGFYQCPCRDSYGDLEKDRDIRCPCVYNVPDQQEFGHCFCGLYLSDEFGKTGKVPVQIPERRPKDKFPD